MLNSEDSTSSSLLILGTDEQNEHKSFMVNSQLEPVETNFTFADGTEVVDSCSLTWNDEQYVFGGASNKNQISKVENCQLTQVGALDFNFTAGTCGVVNDKIVLCFGNEDTRGCYYGSDPLQVNHRLPESTFGHAYTRIATAQGKYFRFL